MFREKDLWLEISDNNGNVLECTRNYFSNSILNDVLAEHGRGMDMSENPLKIVFAGLDAAGKTTIYKRTMEEIDVDSLKELKPTKYIQRSSYDFLGLDMAVWDLGGQESYRQKYLNKPEIFNQTKALIFVVDLQDPQRFQEAYNYFVDILKILVNVTPMPKVYVLFHKFDPDKMNILRPDFYKATKLFRQADKILQNAKFVGFATSIYSESIALAIHRIILENFPEIRLKRVTKDKATRKPQAEPKPEAPKEKPQVTDTGLPVKETKSEPEAKPIMEPAKPAPAKEAPKEKPEPAKPAEPAEPEESVVYEKPPELDDLAPTVLNHLTRILDEKLQQTPEIIAIAVLNYEGKVLVSVAKDNVESKKISILSDVISSLNVKVFFDELGDIEYRGLGHISLGDFDIYFAKVSDSNAMAVFANDVSTLMLENAQDMVKAVRDVLKLAKAPGKGEEKEKEKPLTKESLLTDLRSKLKGLGGYKEI